MELLENARSEYERLTKFFISNNISVSTMESCTSGLVASLITDTQGASAIFKGSFVAYSNEAKLMMGVPSEIINTYGVYSEETAQAMAKCCKERFSSDIGIGVTGTFGNKDPNNEDSVPGVVYFSIANGDEVHSYRLELEEALTYLSMSDVEKVNASDRLSLKLIVALEISKRILH